MDKTRETSTPEPLVARPGIAGPVFDPIARNPYLAGYDVPDPDVLAEPEPAPVSAEPPRRRASSIARYGPVILLVVLAALAFEMRGCGESESAHEAVDSRAPVLEILGGGR